MIKFLHITACSALALNLAAAPVQASKESDQAAAAALLLLGVAALAHNNDHHADGKHFTQAEKVADFERGYSDGLYNARYDSRHSTMSYGDGYSAGLKERDNRLAHRRPTSNAKAPTKVIRACVSEAARRWSRNNHEVHAIASRNSGGNHYQVEVASGHRHGNCTVNSNSKVTQFNKGRL